MQRERHCVYVADSPAQGEAVVAFLAGEGIPARVMDEATLGGLAGLTFFSPTGAALEGLQVWVLDEVHIDQARAQLARFDAARIAHRSAHVGETVQVTCEHCGMVCTFPGERRGGIEDCPHCGEYIDIPDPGEPDPFEGIDTTKEE